MTMRELKTRITLIRVAMFTQAAPMICGIIMMLVMCGEPTESAPANAFIYQFLIAGFGAIICAISGFVFLIASRYEYLLIKKYNKKATIRRVNGMVHIKTMKPIGYSIIHAE